ATNLLGPGGDTNGVEDVFVRDRLLGVTERVSVPAGGGEANGASSSGPSISADGRYVAFASAATNLLGPGADSNGVTDVFVHDRLTGLTERVSVSSAGNEGSGGTFTGPILAADGRSVAFSSRDTNLVGAGTDTNGVADVYVRRLDPADPLGVDHLLFPDGTLDDTVLEVLDAPTGMLTTLCPAEQVAVSTGRAAFLRPESAGASRGPQCFGPSLTGPDLNGDSDTD